jgi:hypothetical protein
VRRIAIIVSLLCVLALAIGLTDPAPRAPAAAADAPTLLTADQTLGDGNNQVLGLVPALSTAHLAQGSHSVGSAPQAPWPAGHGAVSVLARAPPREPGNHFAFPSQTRDANGPVTFAVTPLPDFGAWQESTPMAGTPTP